jgi:hypothetical protein
VLLVLFSACGSAVLLVLFSACGSAVLLVLSSACGSAVLLVLFSACGCGKSAERQVEAPGFIRGSEAFKPRGKALIASDAL